MLKIKVDLGGGLELLFGGQKYHVIEMDDATEKPTVASLLAHMKAHLLQQRPELFLAGATVRPGILVLINDADWELEGQLEYQLQNNDSISFISTLHGG